MGTRAVTDVTSVTTQKSPQTRIKPRILKKVKIIVANLGKMWKVSLVAASGTQLQPETNMTTQFQIGQIVKGIRAGEFKIIAFREIGGITHAILKAHQDGKLAKGQLGLPLDSILPL